MPNVTTSPRSNSNGEQVTEFLDTVYTTPTTYTFPNTQNRLKIKNNGFGSLSLTVNGLAVTMLPTESKEFYGSIDSFVIASNGGVQSFEVLGTYHKEEDAKTYIKAEQMVSNADRIFSVLIFDMNKVQHLWSQSVSIRMTYDMYFENSDDLTDLSLLNRQIFTTPTPNSNVDGGASIEGVKNFNYVSGEVINVTESVQITNTSNNRYLKILLGIVFKSSITQSRGIPFSIKNLRVFMGDIELDFVNFVGYWDALLSKAYFPEDSEIVKFKDIRNNKKISSEWNGKMLTTFGTSIVWQDGKTWGYYEKEGHIARGYQTIVMEMLGMTIDNRGVSNSTLADDPSNSHPTLMDTFLSGTPSMGGTHIVTIDHARNDFSSNVPIGLLGNYGDIKGNFDVNTFYGAYRYVIESILTDYPKIRIVLVTPVQENDVATNGNGHKIEDYATAIRAIGDFYCLPVADMWKNSGINYYNYQTYKPDTVHPNEAGHELMGRYLAGFINTL